MSVPRLSVFCALLVFAPVALAATPIAVKTTSRNEEAPAAQGSWLAWAKSRAPSTSPFDAWAQRLGSTAWKVNVRNTQAYPGGIDGDRLVYQEIRTAFDADVRLYDLARRRHIPLPAGVNTKRWECCPTISGDWLLFTRGSAQVEQAQFVILRNLRTGERRTLSTLRNRNGRLSSGQISGNYVVWSRCNPTPNCRIVRYELTARTTTVLTTTGDVDSPSVNGLGTVYYARSRRGCGKGVQLVKQPLVGGPAVLASLPAGQDVGVTYADLLTTKDPGPPQRTRVYYDRIACKGSRSDLFRVDDREIVPPTP